MSAYKDKNGRCRETIIQTAKSTPILEMFMLRNIVSSTSNCKVRKFDNEKDEKNIKTK